MGKLLNLQPIDWKKELKQDAQAVLGLLLMMVSYNYFFVPNQIAPGGVTGLATIIYYLWGIPVGLYVRGHQYPAVSAELEAHGYILCGAFTGVDAAAFAVS